MDGRMWPWLRLAAWTAFLVLSLRLLHGETFGSLSIPLGGSDELAAWAERTSPVVMALAVVRLAALAAAWYLAAATILTAVAAVTRWRPLAAVAVRVSPGIVRRLVCRGAGAGLAVGALLAVVPVSPRLAASPVATHTMSSGQPLAATMSSDQPLAATTPRRPPAGRDLPWVDEPTATTARQTSTTSRRSTLTTDANPPTARMIREPDPTDPQPSTQKPSTQEPPTNSQPSAQKRSAQEPPTDTQPSVQKPSAPRPPAPEPTADAERWVVEAGDSFWSIAEETLTAAGSVSPSDVARVCDRLIAVNRDRLIDRDNPDLLVPGQELSIPQS